MNSFPFHASGIIIIMAWDRVLPPSTSISKALSKLAVSLARGVIIGNSFFTSSPNMGDDNRASRAVIQLLLPLSVLISPLCDM